MGGVLALVGSAVLTKWYLADKKAAQVLRELLDGKISSSTFDDSYPASKDRALGAIFWPLWLYIDDDAEIFLVGENEPSDEDRARILRSVTFLESDLEYEWPSLVRQMISWLIGRGTSLPLDIWPFWRRVDLEAAQGIAQHRSQG